MEVFLDYLKTFAVGGLVCMIGQFLINKTRMSSARILVTYMLVGVVLEVCGAFEPIKEFAGSGITVPIIGFGSNLAKGALEGVKTGGMSAVAAGLTTVIVCGFTFGLIARSRSKKM